MKSIQDYYNICKLSKHDLTEHLETLKKYADECESVTEFGTKYGHSASAFLVSNAKKFITYDIEHYNITEKLFQLAIEKPNLYAQYIIENVLDIQIEETDLLFIDTYHTYTQLTQELKRHGNKVKKYIIFHDTETFGKVGEDGKSPGLMQAIEEFKEQVPIWRIKEHFKNCNGLTILEKIY